MIQDLYIRRYLVAMGLSLRLIPPGKKGDNGYVRGSVSPFETPEGQNISIETLIERNKDFEHCNIGLCMGFQYNSPDHKNPYVYALDFDDPDLYAWWKTKNPELAQTPTQRTPRGFHVLIRMGLSSSSGKSERVTFIGEGWHILVEPSTHPSGQPYKWIISPFEHPILNVGHIEGCGLGKVINEMDWEVADYGIDERDDDGEDDWDDPVTPIYYPDDFLHDWDNDDDCE